MRIIITRFWQGRLSEEDTELNPTKNTAWDKDNRRAIVIEAKKSQKEADMDADCDEALRQIAGQKYAEGLYGYEQIFCYGIAFFQKKARVKKGAAGE